MKCHALSPRLLPTPPRKKPVSPLLVNSFQHLFVPYQFEILWLLLRTLQHLHTALFENRLNEIFNTFILYLYESYEFSFFKCILQQNKKNTSKNMCYSPCPTAYIMWGASTQKWSVYALPFQYMNKRQGLGKVPLSNTIICEMPGVYTRFSFGETFENETKGIFKCKGHSFQASKGELQSFFFFSFFKRSSLQKIKPLWENAPNWVVSMQQCLPDRLQRWFRRTVTCPSKFPCWWNLVPLDTFNV